MPQRIIQKFRFTWLSATKIAIAVVLAALIITALVLLIKLYKLWLCFRRRPQRWEMDSSSPSARPLLEDEGMSLYEQSLFLDLDDDDDTMVGTRVVELSVYGPVLLDAEGEVVGGWGRQRTEEV